jgi:hypothetical protein
MHHDQTEMNKDTGLRAENDVLKDKLIAALEDNKRLHERIARMSGYAEDFSFPTGSEHNVPGAQLDCTKE